MSQPAAAQLSPPPYLQLPRSAVRTGGSLCVTLPVAWCERAGISPRTLLLLEAYDDGRLVLTKWNPNTPRPAVCPPAPASDPTAA